MTGRPPDSRWFFSLLHRRSRRNAAEIDRRIDARAGREVAVLMSDSSGFTRRSHEQGVVSFLAAMVKCYRTVLPLLRRRGGQVISFKADNILCLFDRAEDAVRAAVEVQRAVRKRNAGLRVAEKFNLCIGIDCGRAIRLSDDVYGPCVNVASKLGEDMADKDEILITGEVARRVKGRFRCVYARTADIGRRNFELYRVPAGR